jgi:peptidyl-prolyl cis-trans isomerase SurA
LPGLASPGRRLGSAAAAVGAALVASLVSLGAAAQDTLRIAARVNDDVITGYELQQRTRFAMNTSRLADSADNRQRMQRQVLTQMIDERLQLQDAKRNGVTVSAVEINERISQVEAVNGMQRGQLRQAVTSAGLPFQMLEEQIKANLAWVKLVRRRMVPQIEISEAEINESMRQLRANVGKQETRVAEIFLAVDRPDQADEVRRSADRIVAQLKGGAPFSAVAQQFSQAATAAVGGDLGWVLPGSLDPAVEQVLGRLQPRQISDPIRSATGYHIVAVIDRRSVGRASSPDEVRAHVIQMVTPLPANANAAEIERQSNEARSAIAQVRKCSDLRSAAARMKGATTNDLESLRVGEMPPHIRDQLITAPIGTAIGPFRVPAGVQVLAICSREGNDGLPSRDVVSQNIRTQKIESAARRYMRELRRNALIDIKV